MACTYRITYGSFLVFSFALSAAMWYHVRTTFDAVTLVDVGLSMFFMVCSMALFILALFLFPPYEILGIFALFCAGFLVFLPFHVSYLVAVALAFLILAYAATEIRAGAKQRLTVSFYALLVSGVPTLLTALALLFAFVGYFYPFNLNNARVNSGMFTYLVPGLEKLAEVNFPYYRAGMSIDEFFSSSVKESVKAQFGSASVQEKQFIANEVAQRRKELSKQFGAELTGKETLGDILALVTNAYLKRYLSSYKNYIPFIVAVSVFLSIKSVEFLLDRLAILLVWLVAKILITSGVMVKRKIPAERETLGLA